MITSIQRLGFLTFWLLVSFLVHTSSHAQSVTDGATPLGLSPGAPAGSYASGDFDALNLYNGDLGVRLPLLGIAGRGRTNLSAQTSADLQGKYGKSLEVYSVSQSIWMTPEYSPDGQVCRMRLYPKRLKRKR